MKWGLPISPSLLIWCCTGFIRYISEVRKNAVQHRTGQDILTHIIVQQYKKSIAVLLPCYNEEIVIEKTIKSLLHSVPGEQIFVISDGSTDNTAAVARAAGCQVLELMPGRGKAAALEAGLTYFNILERFQYVLMADADALFAPNFVQQALKLFIEDEKIVAVAGYARTPWKRHLWPRIEMFFVGYRVRLYRVYQLFLMYAWSWSPVNASPVVPGFASMYKADVLKQLTIHVPGMAIEDFNMAFQIQKKKLGKIAHHPSAYAVDQDPNNLDDYIRQIERWNVGFWQTVKHHGVWPSRFWLIQGWFMAEVLVFSVGLLLLPLIIIVMTITVGQNAVIEYTVGSFNVTSYHLFVIGVYFGFFVIDYLMTLFVAILDRRYMLMFYGLGFTFLRIIDSIILLFSIPAGFISSSSGRWVPPKRYQQVQEEAATS